MDYFEEEANVFTRENALPDGQPDHDDVSTGLAFQ